MTTPRILVITVAVGLIAVCACSNDTTSPNPDSSEIHRSHPHPNYAIHQTGDRDWSDPDQVESVARANLLIVSSELLWGSDSLEAMDVPELLKSHNPDCKVIGYILTESVRLNWFDDPIGSYTRTLYDRLSHHWAYTTTGDTLSNWPRSVVVNILDQDCRDIIVSTFTDYQTQSVTQFDGVFWDYFSHSVWIPDFVSCEGEPELDGDGIPMLEDEDELKSYHRAQEDLVKKMRVATGNHFIQILNGRRANSDPALASLGDGMNYELFPTMELPGPERMRSAVDPTVPNSLWHAVTWPRTAAGGPYLLLENANKYFYLDHLGVMTELRSGDIFRVLGLLIDGVYPIWAPNGEYQNTWPLNPLSLGKPTGPTQIDGDIFTREFTHGSVWMEMKGGDWPNPFRYRITIDGDVAEELDVPYHYP